MELEGHENIWFIKLKTCLTEMLKYVNCLEGKNVLIENLLTSLWNSVDSLDTTYIISL